MTIADAVWLAAALLHMENAQAADFSVQEIAEKAIREKLVDGFRPGLQVHVAKHCVANKSPNPARHRMLFETTRGRRRLFRTGDFFHPNREGGRVKPEIANVPHQFLGVLRWYERFYDKGRALPRIDLMASPLNDNRFKIENQEKPASPPTEVGDLLECEVPARTAAAVGPGGEVVIPMGVRQELGIKEGTRFAISRNGGHLVLQPITEDYIRSLRGCCKGEDSLVDALIRERRNEK